MARSFSDALQRINELTRDAEKLRAENEALKTKATELENICADQRSIISAGSETLRQVKAERDELQAKIEGE